MEALTAVSFIAASRFIPLNTPLTSLSFFVVLLTFPGISAAIVIAVSDLRYKIIPNGAVSILAILGGTTLYFRESIIPHVLAALFLSLLLASLWFFSQGKWMGLGDAKLIFATSLLTGFPHSLVAFFFAFWLGGALGIILLLLRKKTLQSQMPFGPFILLGSLLSHFFTSAFLESTGLAYFFL